jgi:hypothetical protein
MRNRIAIALLAAVASVPPLVAQRGGMTAHFAGSSGFLGSGQLASAPGSVSVTFGQPPSPGRAFPHRFFPTEFFLDAPLFADYSVMGGPQQIPAVLVIQTSPPTTTGVEGTEPAKASAAPLLIEWRGDRYVRLDDAPQRGSLRRERKLPPDYAEDYDARTKASGSRRISDVGPRALAPAVLVYRDGRREDVSKYWIGGGVIYVNYDHWTNGAWNKKIELAQLDLPLTFKLNRERGVNFVLPAAPNEIVTRP